jgi:hypothetical protein
MAALGREIVANAEIAVLKLRLFEAAFLISLLAFILAVAAIVHLVCVKCSHSSRSGPRRAV